MDGSRMSVCKLGFVECSNLYLKLINTTDCSRILDQVAISVDHRMIVTAYQTEKLNTRRCYHIGHTYGFKYNKSY